MAEKYFGPNWASQNIIGEVLERVQNDDNYIVAGVVAEVPKNSHLAFDFLRSSTGIDFLAGDPNYLSFSAMTYLMLDEQTAPEITGKSVSGFGSQICFWARIESLWGRLCHLPTTGQWVCLHLG